MPGSNTDNTTNFNLCPSQKTMNFPGSCFLFIANLPRNWSNSDLHQELWKIFGSFGLMHCRATRDAKQLPIAFLRFTSPIILENLCPIILGNRTLRIEYGRAESEEEEPMELCFPTPVTVIANFKHFLASEMDLQLLLMRFGRVLEMAVLEKEEESKRITFRALFGSPQEAFWCFDALNRYPVEGISIKISFQN